MSYRFERVNWPGIINSNSQCAGPEHAASHLGTELAEARTSPDTDGTIINVNTKSRLPRPASVKFHDRLGNLTRTARRPATPLTPAAQIDMSVNLHIWPADIARTQDVYRFCCEIGIPPIRGCDRPTIAVWGIINSLRFVGVVHFLLRVGAGACEVCNCGQACAGTHDRVRAESVRFWLSAAKIVAIDLDVDDSTPAAPAPQMQHEGSAGGLPDAAAPRPEACTRQLAMGLGLGHEADQRRRNEFEWATVGLGRRTVQPDQSDGINGRVQTNPNPNPNLRTRKVAYYHSIHI
ncbi:hypothetical protein B0H10DRAFT_2323094 [Mycena sp. CBHHK59/15]|nr:hypothetical protein B0H10DRAFT_2323094 [Mycena sp. CBHHK59/15]